ncbi:MAG TPA: VOC family protein [Mycobacteriales bacterium]|jgi:catechol 2,3-dioxygenase-like lactoylglutathione lyase family enzyme|nr:VOC family protein [Mycobacteriales bacterium]
MRSDVQSSAEFLRLPGVSPDGVTEFYRDVVGLPSMRSYPGIEMLWGGEDAAFELKYETTPDPSDESDPATAQLIPVLRSYDLAATRERLAAAGHPPVLEQERHGAQTFYVLGPDGLLTGFTFRDPASTLPADVEALRRWTSGARRLPNTPPMAPELQYVCRIVLHASDVARSSAFYRDAYGLDLVAEEAKSRVHTLGDTAVLEIAPGGEQRPVPADRFSVKGTFLLRCHDLDALTRDAFAAGARSVGDEIFYDVGVRIRYLADPDGAVAGFIQRTDAGGGEEDFEANRRWASRASASVS